ncbi:helix-turn-helix domain-containing protein [Dickeya oryzae]|uniref:LexA family protein n=1 Tax=Dickeya oryzae TaxID=1240404 RepID=UPI001AECDF56|nr:S24 family peptidase [Dickeya oryzae]MBP2845403.1 helix-turn-helix domain-containing protein [Dickeya oryzae]
MNKYESLGERLFARREELQMTQETLADKAGVTRMAISKIELGVTQKPRADNLFALAKALKVNPTWLVSGRGEKELSGITAGLVVDNATPAEILTREVPLISWVQAGSFTEAVLLPREDYTYYPCPVKCSEHSFALRIEGESMLPRFEPGDIIYVDPELIDPPSGKYVIVRLNGNFEATFKQLQIMDGQRYLKALNPDYPPEARFLKINGDCELIGTVVCHVKPV